MKKTIKPMNQTCYNRWAKHPDFKYRKKQISTWIVELLYGTDRGGTILIWEEGTSELEHIWINNDDKTHKLFDEVNFMYWQNAVNAYKEIHTVGDIINLAWENR